MTRPPDPESSQPEALPMATPRHRFWRFTGFGALAGMLLVGLAGCGGSADPGGDMLLEDAERNDRAAASTDLVLTLTATPGGTIVAVDGLVTNAGPNLANSVAPPDNA
jgi:hypothetical protein